MRLPIGPVQLVEAVRLVDEAGGSDDQTGAFQLICDRLCVKPWTALGAVPTGGRVEIELQVGFGTADEVPEDLREALLHLIGAMYRSRTQGAASGAAAIGLPRQVQAILDARKQVRL